MDRGRDRRTFVAAVLVSDGGIRRVVGEALSSIVLDRDCFDRIVVVVVIVVIAAEACERVRDQRRFQEIEREEKGENAPKSLPRSDAPPRTSPVSDPVSARSVKGGCQ
jgi:hypothetical protein